MLVYLGVETDRTTDVGQLDRMFALCLSAQIHLALPVAIHTLTMHTALRLGPDIVVGLHLQVVCEAVEALWRRLWAFLGANPYATVALDALAQPIGYTALIWATIFWLGATLVATATAAGLPIALGHLEKDLTLLAFLSRGALFATTTLLLLPLTAALLHEISLEVHYLAPGPDMTIAAQAQRLHLEVILRAIILAVGRTLCWGIPYIRTCDPRAFVII